MKKIQYIKKIPNIFINMQYFEKKIEYIEKNLFYLIFVTPRRFRSIQLKSRKEIHLISFVNLKLAPSMLNIYQVP